MVKTVRRCVIYLRISLDNTGERLGVQRHDRECRRIATERGWQIVETYTDNSVSSKKGVARPEYERMMSDYALGRFDAILCWDLDRLTRVPRELEDMIDACEAGTLALVTANGEADLTTDAGQLFARIKVAVARGEVQRKGERQKLAYAQRVERGRVPAGVRLTGYDQAGAVIPEEAALVRDLFARFNAGESLHSIARRMNESGLTTRRGGPWRPSSVRTILTNARYCGRQVFKGQATGHQGDWEAIVDEATFDTTQSVLTDPRRITNREGTERKHLGGSLYVCGTCGNRLVTHGGPRRYRCRDFGHVTRSADPIDAYVTSVVTAWLESVAVGEIALAPPSDDDDPGLARISDLRGRLRQVEADYDDDLIDARRYKTKRDKVLADLKAAERDHARTRSSSALASIAGADSPADAFLNAPLGVQRTIIDDFMEVRLHTAPRGRRTFDPSTVEIIWKASV